MNRFQMQFVMQGDERLFQVGGSVRDRLLGRAAGDADWVLLSPDPEGAAARLQGAGLAPVLGREGGRAWRGRGIDLTVWSWPQGQPLEQALAEEALGRDLTLNAIYSPWGEEGVIDPLGGVADLRRGVLRATREGVFARDPVRVLRLARLASTLGMAIDPTTLAWAGAVDGATAAGERIGREVVQWLTGSLRPGRGLEWWAQTGAIRALPEVAALRGVAQRADYHPEGDVWIHTGQVLDRAAEIGRTLDPESRTTLMLAALFHDLGKAVTTSWEQGRWRARGHEAISKELTQARLAGWGLGKRISARVIRLVADHGRPLALARDGAGLLGWWRLLGDHPCPDLLFLLAQADSQGRLPPGEAGGQPPLFEAQGAFRAALTRLERVPVVSGEVLLAEGVRPGPAIGQGLMLLRCAAFLGRWQAGEPVAPLLRRAGLLPGRAKAREAPI